MELFHIAVAMTVLAAVLFIVFMLNDSFVNLRKQLSTGALVVAALLVSFFGFVLHEMGHKLTAQHFGHWSEFRANWLMLAGSLGIAIAFHLPFAAPGATFHTAESRREQGKISAMGPLVNYAIALIALPFMIAWKENTLPHQLGAVVVFFSTILALFNLLPIWQLDGRKILDWNIAVWVVMVAVGVALLTQGAAKVVVGA